MNAICRWHLGDQRKAYAKLRYVLPTLVPYSSAVLLVRAAGLLDPMGIQPVRQICPASNGGREVWLLWLRYCVPTHQELRGPNSTAPHVGSTMRERLKVQPFPGVSLIESLKEVGHEQVHR